MCAARNSRQRAKWALFQNTTWLFWLFQTFQSLKTNKISFPLVNMLCRNVLAGSQMLSQDNAHSTFRISYAKLYKLLSVDDSTNRRSEIIFGDIIIIKYGCYWIFHNVVPYAIWHLKYLACVNTTQQRNTHGIPDLQFTWNWLQVLSHCRKSTGIWETPKACNKWPLPAKG